MPREETRLLNVARCYIKEYSLGICLPHSQVFPPPVFVWRGEISGDFQMYAGVHEGI